MKKVLVVAILISYSIASFGVSINYFYCCGKLKTVSLTTKTGEETYKSKSTNGYARNLTVTIKIMADQKIDNQTTYHFAASTSPFILHSDNYNILNIASSGNINQLYKRPPPDNLPSRQLLYFVFRI